MTPEELNRDIAEKLMRLKNFRKSKCGRYWWNGNIKWPERTPNYFTEGWEQVEDKLAELGLWVESQVDKANGLKGKPIVYSCRISETPLLNYQETRESARYEAMKQAWPEIVRRIDKK